MLELLLSLLELLLSLVVVVVLLLLLLLELELLLLLLLLLLEGACVGLGLEVALVFAEERLEFFVHGAGGFAHSLTHGINQSVGQRCGSVASRSVRGRGDFLISVSSAYSLSS